MQLKFNLVEIVNTVINFQRRFYLKKELFRIHLLVFIYIALGLLTSQKILFGWLVDLRSSSKLWTKNKDNN